MNKVLQFASTLSEQELIKATKSYFLGQGFKLTSETADKLIFTRGSTLNNMVTFNPLKWKSVLTIKFSNSSVNSVFDINTTGQTVTLKEEVLWENFIENYKRSVVDGVDYCDVNNNLLKQTKTDSLKYLKPALFGAVVVGIPAGFIAYYTGLGSIVGGAAAAGAVSFMMYKIEEDRNNSK